MDNWACPQPQTLLSFIMSNSQWKKNGAQVSITSDVIDFDHLVVNVHDVVEVQPLTICQTQTLLLLLCLSHVSLGTLHSLAVCVLLRVLHFFLFLKFIYFYWVYIFPHSPPSFLSPLLQSPMTTHTPPPCSQFTMEILSFFPFLCRSLYHPKGSSYGPLCSLLAAIPLNLPEYNIEQNCLALSAYTEEIHSYCCTQLNTPAFLDISLGIHCRLLN